MVQELIQPGGVETPVAEMPQEKATTEIGEASTLQEEEATTEVRETSTLRDSPKNSSSPDLPLGKEMLVFKYFPFTVMADILVICRGH